MTLAWVLLFAIALVAVYWFAVRPWLRSIPSLQDEWDAIDKWECMLWERSRTILAAKLIWIPSALLAAHDFLATIALDWTPITARLLSYVPDPYKPLALPIGMAIIARFFQYMRKITTDPVPPKSGA